MSRTYHLTLAQVYGADKYAGSEAVRDINKKLDWSSATAVSRIIIIAR